MPRLRPALLATALAALAGCSQGRPDATRDVAAADFPAHVAGFDRVGPPARGRLGVVVGYQLVADAEKVVIATVHFRPSGSLLPALDRGPPPPEEVAAAALRQSIAQVRRFYPALRAGAVRDTYLVRDGVLRPGRQVTLQYDDMLAGRMQPIDLDIAVLCCTARGEVVEYRFRHAADLLPAIAVAAFMEALPWVIAPPSSGVVGEGDPTVK